MINGSGIIKTKKNQGSTLLIPKEQWVHPSQLNGEERVLNSPIINKAFKKILEYHKPSSNIAFVSLCTSTRPYSKSRKWKKYIEINDNKMDLIICSNGGIIPIEFENCYPFLTYDAHGNDEFDELYIKKTYAKLKIFFKKFNYKYIIFNFRPNLRNVVCARIFKKQAKNPENIYIYPSKKAYRNAQKNKFKPEGYMFPDLSYECLDELYKIIEEIDKKEDGNNE